MKKAKGKTKEKSAVVTTTPSTATTTKSNSSAHERIAFVLQGGGALGSYQLGACEALMQAGYQPDWIVGVSIGAINSAIIAGNAPEQRVEKLEKFWNSIASPSLGWGLGRTLQEHNQGLFNWWGGMLALLFGQSGFFTPNYCNPLLFWQGDLNQLSYYSVDALRSSLENLVDFDRINDRKKNGMIFSVGAVNVRTGRMKYFNNVHDKISVQHILASGALPPGFPAVEIDGEYYWDGGLHSNTPLNVILEAKAPKHTLCFMIDLFSAQGNLPTSFLEIEARKKDIVYSSHAQHTTLFYTLCQNLRGALATLEKKLPATVKNDPEIANILKMSHPKVLDIVRIVYSGCANNAGSKDYNFLPAAIREHRESGYHDAMDILRHREWEHQQPDHHLGANVFGNINPLKIAKEDWVSLDDA